MGIVGERLGYGIAAACRIGISVWIGCLDDDSGIRIPRSIIIKVVHDEITIPLAHEPIGYTLAVLMMIAGCKGILTLAADAAHQIFLAILYGYHTPVAGGIEDIGYQFLLFANCQSLAYFSPLKSVCARNRVICLLLSQKVPL